MNDSTTILSLDKINFNPINLKHTGHTPILSINMSKEEFDTFNQSCNRDIFIIDKQSNNINNHKEYPQ